MGCEDMGFLELMGSFSQISAASDGTVYGIMSGSSDSKVVRLNNYDNSWILVNNYATAPTLTRISVGSSDEVYGIDTNGNVYKLNANKLSFDKIEGQTLIDIAANSKGEVLGFDYMNYAYELYKNPEIWSQIMAPTGNLKQIDNNMGIDDKNKIYRYIDGNWKEISTPNTPQLIEISVADDGTIYGFNANHDIYRLNEASSWTQICNKKAISISAVKEGKIYIVDQQNKVYVTKPSCDIKWDGIKGEWHCLPDITPYCAHMTFPNFCQTGCNDVDCPDGYRQKASYKCIYQCACWNALCYKDFIPLSGHGDIVNMDNNETNDYYQQYDVDIVIIISIFISILCTSIILCVIYKYSAFKTKPKFQEIASMDQDDETSDEC